MEREAEVDQIKRELAILQDSYALYRRTAGRLRTFCVALMPLLAIGVAALAIRLFLFDALYGVFFVAAMLIFGSATAWLMISSGLRWIDLASQHPRGIYDPGFFNPDARWRPRSDAEVVEQQIADRARRLAELGEAGFD